MDEEYAWVTITGADIILKMRVDDADTWEVAHNALHLIQRRMEIRQRILNQITAPTETIDTILGRLFATAIKPAIPDS